MLIKIEGFDNQTDAEAFALEAANFDGLWAACLPKAAGRYMVMCYNAEPKHFTEGPLAEKVTVYLP